MADWRETSSTSSAAAAAFLTDKRHCAMAMLRALGVLGVLSRALERAERAERTERAERIERIERASAPTEEPAPSSMEKSGAVVAGAWINRRLLLTDARHSSIFDLASELASSDSTASTLKSTVALKIGGSRWWSA